MYIQKQSQPTRKNRRMYPRAKGRLTTEISQPGQAGAMVGTLTNLSVGGCYVETSALLLPKSQVRLTFSVEHNSISLNGEVVRMDMGIGAALRFVEESQESRNRLQHILEQMAGSEDLLERQRNRNAAAGNKI
jgi:hypothetical protein